MSVLQKQTHRKENTKQKKERKKQIKRSGFPEKGVFTRTIQSIEEISPHLAGNKASNIQQNTRLYVEVRYVNKVFRLRCNGKKIETTEYAENLMQYLDDSAYVDSLTSDDLKTILEKV